MSPFPSKARTGIDFYRSPLHGALGFMPEYTEHAKANPVEIACGVYKDLLNRVPVANHVQHASVEGDDEHIDHVLESIVSRRHDGSEHSHNAVEE